MWMQERISFISGDFTKASPAENRIPSPREGAGTYVIRHVLHDWDDEQESTFNFLLHYNHSSTRLGC